MGSETMNKPCYIPILKYKQGEQIALRQLAPSIRERVRPILLLVNQDKPGVLVKKIRRDMGDNTPFYVDLHPKIRSVLNEEQEKSYLESVYTELGAVNLPFVPIIQHDCSATQLALLRGGAYTTRGMGIRVPLSKAKYLPSIIAEVCASTGCPISSVDLIIDAGQISSLSDDTIEVLASSAADAITIMKTRKMALRILAIAASAFPNALSGIKQNAVTRIRRLDWLLWKAVRAIHEDVVFADFGVDDPLDPTYTDGATIIATIRYTLNDDWFIARGKHDASRPNDYSQFHAVARLIAADNTLFRGESYSFGDGRIHDVSKSPCTGKGCKHGNLATWVTVGLNHHMTHVVDLLSTPVYS